MGTGVISALFHNFPYGSPTVLDNLSVIFTIINLCLFVTFSGLSITRYALFPHIWRLMLLHPVQSLYLGCIPMGFATLINSGVVLSEDRGFGGKTFVYVLWAAWWVDSAVSLLVCFGMVHIMVTRHKHSLDTMTAAWLLPVVAPIVASTTGHLVASILIPHSPSQALITSTISLFMVLVGLTLALMILTIYLSRLVIHGLPASGLIVSVFLPLGPCGQGGYSLLVGADIFAQLLPALGSPSLAVDAVRGVLFAGAFTLWAIGSMWLVLALAGFADVAARNRLSFALPFWGLIFPNGVYTLLTLQLGAALGGARFFVAFGAGWAALTMIAWAAVAAGTARYAVKGTIFHAPCLENAALALPRPAPMSTAA